MTHVQHPLKITGLPETLRCLLEDSLLESNVSTQESKCLVIACSDAYNLLSSVSQANISCLLCSKFSLVLCRPVPGVIWRRTDGKELSVRAQIRSFGLELYFSSIEYDDAGSYECDGYNSANPTPVKTTVSADSASDTPI